MARPVGTGDLGPDKVVRAWEIVVLGLIAALISLGRVLLANSNALVDLVWAEDGLFPLCVRKAGALACTSDSYAGYLPFMPRVVGAIVAPFPLESWALVTNILAAAEAGLAAAAVYWIIRRRGASAIAAVLVSLLIVAAPILSVEALNVAVNSYLLLLFVASIALAFPPRERFPVVAYSVGLLVTALTIPSAVVLLAAIAIQAFRGALARRTAGILAGSLTLGLIVQAVVAKTATDRRPMSVSLDSIRAWMDSIPQSIATFVPGLNFGTGTDAFGMAILPASPIAGLLAAATMVALGTWLSLRGRGPWSPGYGILILMGLGLGAIPAITGEVSNRYFVVPALLWFAAILLAIDEHLSGRRKTAIMAAIAIVLGILWWPSTPAAAVRATPTPSWSEIVAYYRTVCATQPDPEITVLFSPYDWQPARPSGVTTSTIHCADLRP